MVRIYCTGNHGTREGLCGDCGDLLKYALARLDKCPFHVDKPACANCSVHCYQPEMREKVKTVMRYAGPRMITRHPILALFHMAQSRGNKADGQPARD